MSQNLNFKLQKACKSDILQHLKECDNNFTPALSQRIDLNEYSEKIFQKSVTFEGWDGEKLEGLIAAYIHYTNHKCFITNVSVLKKYMGMGIASHLLKMCMEYLMKNNISEINLDVYFTNESAINLYRKFGFNKISLIEDQLKMNLIL